MGMYLGGAMPHKLGTQGLTPDNMKNWRQWYARLDRPHVWNHKTATWSQHRCVLRSGETASGNVNDWALELCLRSHVAAVYLPSRRSVIIFGGSRYFTGEYFHDLLELQIPQAHSCDGGAANNMNTSLALDGIPPACLPRFMR